MNFSRLLLILSTIFLGFALSSNSFATSSFISHTLPTAGKSRSQSLSGVRFVNDTEAKYSLDVTFDSQYVRNELLYPYDVSYIDLSDGCARVTLTNLDTGQIKLHGYMITPGHRDYYISKE